jgi:hypothetical protein
MEHSRLLVFKSQRYCCLKSQRSSPVVQERQTAPRTYPSHTTPVLNLAVPPHLTQQHEHRAPFRAIFHPPKSLPPVSTHQYNTRLRRILSACRILGRNNSKTNSSTPTHPYPNSNPNSKNPNPNTDTDSDPRPRPQPLLLHRNVTTNP